LGVSFFSLVLKMAASWTRSDAEARRQVSLLAADDAADVMAFLQRDEAQNLFMISWAENYGMVAARRPDLFHFRCVRSGGQLLAVMLVITERLALVESVDTDAARQLGEWYRDADFRLEHIVSATESVAPFWQAYSEGGKQSSIAARLGRDQELFVLPRAAWSEIAANEGADARGKCRLAGRRDADSVFWASARMHTEETLEDPLERDANHFRRHVEHRIDNDRTYVWIDDMRRLVFKADISAQSSFGAQVSGVYTPPNLRGRGIATRGMRDICHALFNRGFPIVTLYVNEENAAAKRVYQKVGFEYHSAYQTIFVADP
jgi:predicted GNAT family acetyltransferase